MILPLMLIWKKRTGIMPVLAVKMDEDWHGAMAPQLIPPDAAPVAAPSAAPTGSRHMATPPPAALPLHAAPPVQTAVPFSKPRRFPRSTASLGPEGPVQRVLPFPGPGGIPNHRRSRQLPHSLVSRPGHQLHRKRRREGTPQAQGPFEAQAAAREHRRLCRTGYCWWGHQSVAQSWRAAGRCTSCGHPALPQHNLQLWSAVVLQPQQQARVRPCSQQGWLVQLLLARYCPQVPVGLQLQALTAPRFRLQSRIVQLA
ncbi:hypothetical protein ABBQ38_012852 [Trebouxia sp. C0009 RCD-2024]